MNMTSDRTERLAEAFSCASEIGFAVLDRELRYQALNRCLADINGLPEESHLGITVSDIFGDLAERTAEPHYRRVLASGATANLRLQTLTYPTEPKAEVTGA